MDEESPQIAVRVFFLYEVLQGRVALRLLGENVSPSLGII